MGKGPRFGAEMVGAKVARFERELRELKLEDGLRVSAACDWDLHGGEAPGLLPSAPQAWRSREAGAHHPVQAGTRAAGASRWGVHAGLHAREGGKDNGGG